MKFSKSGRLPERYEKSSGFREFKLADQIQKELSILFQKEVKDPRIGFLTITDVEVSFDLSIAKVYYSVYPSNKDKIKVVREGLDAVKSFLRSRLAKSIRIHHLPDLKFVYDDSIEKGRDLSNLIEKACAQSQKNSSD